MCCVFNLLIHFFIIIRIVLTMFIVLTAIFLSFFLLLGNTLSCSVAWKGLRWIKVNLSLTAVILKKWLEKQEPVTEYLLKRHFWKIYSIHLQKAAASGGKDKGLFSDTAALKITRHRGTLNAPQRNPDEEAHVHRLSRCMLGCVELQDAGINVLHRLVKHLIYKKIDEMLMFFLNLFLFCSSFLWHNQIKHVKWICSHIHL